MRLVSLFGVVLCVGCGPAPTPADTSPPDIDAPRSACIAGCGQFNDGASECGVSNYDCVAVCAESESIGADTGCSAETAAFWDCFAAAPRGAFCTPAGACTTEREALDACVALAPSTDCLRACVACGDSSYGTCALGCARRDGNARGQGCEASYAAYYTCRLSGGCPRCSDETAGFTSCWSEACMADPRTCPVTP